MSTRNGKKQKKPLQTTLGKAPHSSTFEKPVDLGVVGKPIHTSLFGLHEILNMFQTGSAEVRAYARYECDILYECRVCRNIFRSFANFVLHKRNYCRENYNPRDHSKNNVEENNYDIIYADLVETSRENTPQPTSSKTAESLNDMKKSLSSALRKLAHRQESEEIAHLALTEDISNASSKNDEISEDRDTIAIESIPSTDAGVFQTMFTNMAQEHGKQMQFMKSEVMELHGLFSNDMAVLSSSGTIDTLKTERLNEKPSMPENTLICTVCNQKFSTRKTLTYHIKYKHNGTRIVYPCPDCKDTFANAWCVFRHLYKVHRKTSAQIKRLRDQVHASAIKKEDEPIKKKAKVDRCLIGLNESNIIQENQQWMDDFEGSNDLQMCGGCGKRFERKAALHSHSQMCMKRIAVCNNLKETAKKVQVDEKIDKTCKPAQITISEPIVPRGAQKRKPKYIRRAVLFDDKNSNFSEENYMEKDTATINPSDSSSSTEQAIVVEYQSPERYGQDAESEKYSLSPRDIDISNISIHDIIGITKPANIDDEKIICENDSQTDNVSMKENYVCNNNANTDKLSSNYNESNCTYSDDKNLLNNLSESSLSENQQLLQPLEKNIEITESRSKDDSLSHDTDCKENIIVENIENEKDISEDSVCNLVEIQNITEDNIIDGNMLKTDEGCNSETSSEFVHITDNISDGGQCGESIVASTEIKQPNASENESFRVVYAIQKPVISTVVEEVDEEQNINTNSPSSPCLINNIDDKLIETETSIIEDQIINIFCIEDREDVVSLPPDDFIIPVETLSAQNVDTVKNNEHDIFEDSEKLNLKLNVGHSNCTDVLFSDEVQISNDKFYSLDKKPMGATDPIETSLPVIIDDNEICKNANIVLVENINEVTIANEKSDTEKLNSPCKRKLDQNDPVAPKIQKVNSDPDVKAPPEVDKKEITLEMKAAKYMCIEDLSCTPCQLKFSSYEQLMRHMSIHFKWFSYQCSKCLFMSYDKKTCLLHARKQHNPICMDNVVFPIPNWKTVNISSEFLNLKHTVYDTSGLDTTEENCGQKDSSTKTTLKTPKTTSVPTTSCSAPSDISPTKKENVRKMIMEVIFGSKEKETTVFTPIPNIVKIDKPPIIDNARPVRNRTKPIHTDFVYDMAQILRPKYKDNSTNESLNKVQGHLKQKKTVNIDNKKLNLKQVDFFKPVYSSAPPLKTYEKKQKLPHVDKQSTKCISRKQPLLIKTPEDINMSVGTSISNFPSANK